MILETVIRMRCSPLRPVVLGFAFFTTAILAICFNPVSAGNMEPVSDSHGEQTAHSSVLDGRTFRGEIGAMGKPAFSDDVWEFDNGMFISRECEKCGFPKGQYWVRFEGDTVHFRTETVCPLTDANLVYTGTVKDGRIQGTYTWTKDRWYWTIEKQFWFEGELVESPEVAASPAR